MAGRPQKPFSQLQDQRRSRRRPQLVVYPVDQLPEAVREQRDAALRAASDPLDRQFGRGMIPRATPPEPTGPRTKPPRRRRPQDQEPVSAAKAKIARERPRDASGHFLPLPGSRRARIRAASVKVPESLAGVTGTEGDVLAALTPPPRRARRPNLIEIADELGDEELDQVIAALVALREARGREAGAEAS